MIRQAVTYVELDISYCVLTYGDSPCQAEIGVTGADKCCNSPGTCQDPDNYTDSTVTLRFAVPADYLRRDIDCIQRIAGVEHTPGTVALGDGLGERSQLRVTLSDGPHSDAPLGFDKYFDERAYNPFEQGTIFGKFRERQPYLRGRALRWYQGFIEDELADMEVRHFVVDSFDGPDTDGTFTIIAKDVLKLLDRDRAQAPVMSTGFLADDIAIDATSAELQPAGIGDDEYGVSGYVTIGGNEVVAYGRDPFPGNDADTVLLLHMDGADGASTFTDSSPLGHSISEQGTPTNDDLHLKFGTASARLQSAGADYLQVADGAEWDLSGNFTIDCWIWPLTLADRRVFSQASSSTVGYRMIAHTDGSLEFSIQNTSTLLSLNSAAAALVADTAFYHVAVERFGNVWTLYLNGAIVDQETLALSVPAMAAAFRVGAGNAGTNSFNGWIDEFRFQHRATWNGVAFTPPAIPYQTSSDILVLTQRGAFNTEATTHSSEDRVQVCLVYTTQSAAAIIRDLEVNYAGVPSAYINLTEWEAEITAFQGQVYSACIPEPTPVAQLVEELLEQAGLAHWVDDKTPALRLIVIREVSSDAEVFSDDKRIMSSLEITDQPGKRISRVQTYYGIIDPTKGIDDADNYRSMELTIDEEAEATLTGYGNVVIKTIKSRWIPQFGGAIAAVLNGILLARYRNPPRKLTFEVMRGASIVPELGGGYEVAAYPLQDQYGAAVEVPIQVTRIEAGPALVNVEGEEMRFANSILADPNHHVIVISTSTNDFNLRTRHDTLYGTPVGGNLVTCIINDGVIVGASTPANDAFDTGDWPASIDITVDIQGRIQGAGGTGGRGSRFEYVTGEPAEQIAATDGGDGGTALKARYDISIDGDGEILAGGSGGGGGGCDFPSVSEAGAYSVGGAGGGGRGMVGGAGGSKRNNGTVGTAGTSEDRGSGGAGRGSPTNTGKGGGNGGLAGAAGGSPANGDVSGISGPSGDAGAAGNAIDGDSFVTEVGTVTITGPRI